MFCKNCGSQVDPLASVCVKCGVAVGVGYNFCQNCGTQTIPGAAVCTQCGASLSSVPFGARKSKIAAGLFGIFLGAVGVHNFYLGYTGKAVAQLLITLLSCFTLSFVSAIWGFIEGILILTDSINQDASGMPLRD